MSAGYPPREVRRAAGIYGMIVTASVLASAGAFTRTAGLAIAVFVTLLVYWLAEEYAELGEHASKGHLPTWRHTRADLVAKWPMVSASYIPLATLLVARLAHASTTTAAFIALSVTVGLLMFYGWKAAQAAGLSRRGQLGMTVAAGALGSLMILLKVLLVHLH